MIAVAARTGCCAAACLSLSLACGCTDGPGSGAVIPLDGRVQAIEARPDAGAMPVATELRMHAGRQFAVVGGNDFARNAVAASAAPLPEGWTGEVRVADDCMQEACLHWIAESDDGLRRVEKLPTVFDSSIRGTTPDIVHHEADQVEAMLERARSLLFPGAGDAGRHEQDPPDPHGYDRNTTRMRWSYDHVRDGIALRSVIVAEAMPWQRPRDARDAEVAARGQGITIIDLQLRSIAFTAPASDPDPRGLAWVADHFRLGGAIEGDAYRDPGCEASQESFRDGCRAFPPPDRPSEDGSTRFDGQGGG